MMKAERDLRLVLSHFDAPDILKYLLVSPELYECTELYAYIYDNYGGELNQAQLIAITDSIDVIYKAVYDALSEHIRRKNTHEPFQFHKWVNPTQAIIGSAKDGHWSI